MLKNKGYWRVKDELFENKILAILSAQKQNLGPEDISFHYNDEWWDRADWTVEPQQSLEELYLTRALQLREKYKTLILRLSGGADSFNILFTCLENNIPIDVIAVNTYTQHINVDHQNHRASLEKINNVFPYLETLKNQGVNFVLKDLDTSYLFDLVKDPEWIFKINAPRFRLVEIQAPRTSAHPDLKEYDDESTCIISGIDKPWITCKQKKIWYFGFEDFIPCLVDPGHSKIVQEPFYYTADMPEITIKQSHVVKNYYKDKMPVDCNEFFPWIKNQLVPLIYPKYWKFTPGDPLPYFEVPVNPYLSINDDIVDDQYEKNKPVYNGHHQGVELADRLIERRFKKSDNLKKDGLSAIYTKSRWLGK